MVIFIAAYSLISFVLSQRINYEVDETLPEVNKKSKTKIGVVVFAAVMLIMLLSVAAMRNGSWLLQPYKYKM